jgi:hypothetical protein
MSQSNQSDRLGLPVDQVYPITLLVINTQMCSISCRYSTRFILLAFNMEYTFIYLNSLCSITETYVLVVGTKFI